MYKIAKPLFFRTETPMHVGSGSDLGHIDLPIQREKHTDFPMVQGSSLKGALREHLEGNVKLDADKIGVHLTFGYDSDGVKGDVKAFFQKDHQDFSGALAFTDARLLLFPVKSYKGIFALVTCPQVLDKFIKELQFICGINDAQLPSNLTITNDKVLVADSSYLGIQGKVILDEYAFEIETDKEQQKKVDDVALKLSTLLGIDIKSEIFNRLAILPNDVFRDFTKLSTEVITRTKIQNDTGTVQSGALFTEEYLPAESYMYSLIAAHRVFQNSKKGDNDKKYDERQQKFPKNKAGSAINTATDVLAFFTKHLKDIGQIGGSSTLGKGIVKFFKSQLSNAKKQSNNGN